MCLLDDEEETVAGTMRPSGDHGRYGSGGLLYYVGRVDKQVKRMGHRINLDTVQQVRKRIHSKINVYIACACKHAQTFAQVHMHAHAHLNFLLSF